MLKLTLWLFVGVFVWALASCSITCPDGNICSDFATCCLTTHGYSCCPYPNAVCCSDLAHCCPSGYRCNQLTEMCEREPWMSILMVKKVPAEEPTAPVLPVSPLNKPENNHVPEKSSVVYCDNYTYCPDGTTCCRYPSGAWWCCGYSPGRCCRDGFNCCPAGYDCDYTHVNCVRQGLRYPFTPKHSPTSVPASVISTSEVKSSLQKTLMTTLTEASGGSAKAGVIRCDSQFSCKKGSTCCKGKTGQWSCCPYPLAVCCSDLAHCCPFGYRCNQLTQMCEREPWMSILMVKKVPAEEPTAPVLPVSPLNKPENSHVPEKSSVVYCDSYTYCSDGYTCCRHPSGAWWCCGYSPGRCCRDGFNCCPAGYDCDYTHVNCVRQGLRYPFTPKHSPASFPASVISTSEVKSSLQKTPMTALTEASGGNAKAGVIRCDSQFFCPAGRSCCKGKTGQWSCCPYPLGQCCEDGVHCCEYGYSCDSTSMSCNRGYSQIPSGAQEPAKTD